jgi:DNA (cytosine-5)-methyltransferase 1
LGKETFPQCSPRQESPKGTSGVGLVGDHNLAVPIIERGQARCLLRKAGANIKKTVIARRTVNFIDLFAGAGGLSQGFRQASGEDIEFRSVFAVEKDFTSAASYAANFGHSVFSRPIEELKRTDLPDLPVDLLVGGPPCQGFSPLGKMSPTHHHPSMNQLWKFYFKVVKWVGPKVFVIENVPEFLKSDEFPRVRKIAANLGYGLAAGVLHAVHFGVPQQRRRGFVVGMRNAVPTLPMPEPFRNGRSVKDAIWELRRKPLKSDLPNAEKFMGLAKYRVEQLHIARNPTPKSVERYRCVPPGGNRFDLMRSRPDLTPNCWKRKKTGSTDVFGRLRWTEPALTIRTEFFKPEKGCYLHPESDRPITHWEAARLQTFPDEYYFCGSKTDIARQIGNAVPPLLAQAIATHLKNYFEQDESSDSSLRTGDPTFELSGVQL